MTIADNIKALRRKYGITQAELGEIAGLTDRAVSARLDALLVQTLTYPVVGYTFAEPRLQAPTVTSQ